MNSTTPEIVSKYVGVTVELGKGNFEVEVPVYSDKEIGKLGLALQNLADSLEKQYIKTKELDTITTNINQGLLLDDILETIFENFKSVIPYNRIGFSLLEDNGQILRAYWAKTDSPIVKLKKGYAALMAGSTLENIIKTGKPRIINDLGEYLKLKSNSHSSKLVYDEGVRSSLTCPLIANGNSIGFMFFSSNKPNMYADAHVEIYQRIAQQLSVIVEKGRFISVLADQKAAIEHQNQELNRLNDLKNTFLGIAAHDLRNPIGAIRSLADLMLNPDFIVTEEEKKQYLEEVFNQSNFMLDLLNDLLDITAIESGKFSLDLDAIPARDFITQIVERHNQLAKPKGTYIILEEVPQGLINADAMRLRQVLDNLISNAVKFSPPASTVWVRASLQNNRWKIEVQDQGPGITIADRQKLFQDFAKLSARPTGNEKSTGLGLSIIRKVVEAHHGQIGVDSKPGEGATFWVTLPAFTEI